MIEYLEYRLFGNSFFLAATGEELIWAHWDRPNGKLNPRNSFLLKVSQQLTEYLAGQRKVFSFKVSPQASPFQQKVWKELTHIPWGETVSYSDMAIAIGSAQSVRAVASAIAKNPIAIFIPCHRVVSKNGRIGGYAGGLASKRKLLLIEGQTF